MKKLWIKVAVSVSVVMLSVAFTVNNALQSYPDQKNLYKIKRLIENTFFKNHSKLLDTRLLEVEYFVNKRDNDYLRIAISRYSATVGTFSQMNKTQSTIDILLRHREKLVNWLKIFPTSHLIDGVNYLDIYISQLSEK